eukprot:m.26789 g.26789  ORF g.26789 m.26789 type:complete len:215 (+) comp7833_c0_seq1:223-867(+)
MATQQRTYTHLLPQQKTSNLIFQHQPSQSQSQAPFQFMGTLWGPVEHTTPPVSVSVSQPQLQILLNSKSQGMVKRAPESVLPACPYKRPSKNRKSLPKHLSAMEKVQVRLQQGKRASQDLRDRKKKYQEDLQKVLTQLKRECSGLRAKEMQLKTEQQYMLRLLQQRGVDMQRISELHHEQSIKPPPKQQPQQIIESKLEALTRTATRLMNNMPP